MEFNNGYILSSTGCKEVCVNGEIIKINPMSEECRGLKRKRDAHEQSKKNKVEKMLLWAINLIMKIKNRSSMFKNQSIFIRHINIKSLYFE